MNLSGPKSLIRKSGIAQNGKFLRKEVNDARIKLGKLL